MPYAKAEDLKAYRERTKDKQREWQRNFYAKNYEKNKDRYKTNREKYEKSDKFKTTRGNWHKSARGKFTHYRLDAKRNNREFTLTLDDFNRFWQNKCHYCGSDIATIGLDRIDNLKGYTLDNVVPCCTKCNLMKLTYSKDDFLDQCFRIVKFQEIL